MSRRPSSKHQLAIFHKTLISRDEQVTNDKLCYRLRHIVMTLSNKEGIAAATRMETIDNIGNETMD